MTSFSVALPLDSGFLRRECPKCARQFKWHHGPTSDRPDTAVEPAVYFCPYCAESAPLDDWWTQEQLEFMTQIAAGPAGRMAADELKDALKPLEAGPITIKASLDYKEPEPPSALHEPADMTLVEPPCHPWEPLKIAEDWREPIHCLVCGDAFRLD
jgi:hypothetical protein